MKKLILLAAIAGIAFVSCKKDRTCECTSSTISRTSTQPGYTFTSQPATTSSTKYSKIKKKNVLAQICVTQEETRTYNQSSFNGTTTVNYVVTEVNKNECELK